MPIPGAAGILVSILVANEAVGGSIGAARYAEIILTIMLALAALMVSSIHFRSFKDLKLNTRTAALALFTIGSSGFISTQLKPAFVMVWLLGLYVLIGLFEWLWNIPRRIRRHTDRLEHDANAPTEPTK